MLNISLFFLLILIKSSAKLTSPGPEFRIIGESYASKGEFPYQVSLHLADPKYSYPHFCSGSIINESFIITAAECMYYRNKNYPNKTAHIKRRNGFDLLVVAGQVELKLKRGSIRVNVKNIIIHPRYNLETKEHNIALLQLEMELPPFNQTNLIKPIVLNYKKVVGGLTCTSSGWGAVEWNTIKKAPSKYAELLKKSIFKTITLEVCRKKFLKSLYPDNEVICAEGIIDKVGKPMDICRVDSGGPLVCNGLLTGIFSGGQCDRHIPGVFTDVWTHLQWIKYDIDKVPKKLPGFISSLPTDKPSGSIKSGTRPNRSNSSSRRDNSEFVFRHRSRPKNNSPSSKRYFYNYLYLLIAIAINYLL